MSTLRKILLLLVSTLSSVRNLWLDKLESFLFYLLVRFRLRLMFLGPMLFSSRPCASLFAGVAQFGQTPKGEPKRRTHNLV